MVTDISYDGKGRLRIDMIGHATDVIHHAHQIATAVLGDYPWKFIEVSGILPLASHVNPDPLPSDMKWKIVAVKRDA